MPDQSDHNHSAEKSFFEQVDEVFEAKKPDFSATLNIALIGKVSTGKSSLMNALLRRKRETLLGKVDAKSGVTTEITCFQLDDRVLIIDSPGLDDIEQAKSDVTKKFLQSIDVALLVLTGSADASQKLTYDEVKKRSKKAIVVLNKIDEWDHLNASAFEDVVGQWKTALGVDEIFPTCAKGFDPRSKPETAYDLRGVDQLRQAIETFLRAEGKDLLLARHMGDKIPSAIAIIASALVAVAGEAFVPGSAAYITATQALAIASLYYLYTGKTLSKVSVLSLLPTFMGRTVGYNLFLWAKSLLPPTGAADALAAVVAVGVTLPMLLAVNTVLASGHELHEREHLSKVFGEIQRRTVATIKQTPMKDFMSVDFWKRFIERFMYS